MKKTIVLVMTLLFMAFNFSISSQTAQAISPPYKQGIQQCSEPNKVKAICNFGLGDCVRAACDFINHQ